MNWGWDAVNGITGVISAICAVVSVLYLGLERKSLVNGNSNLALLSLHKFMSFLFVSSGWALCCLCVLWILEPYGCCPGQDEFRQFYGIVLGFPALLIFLAGVALLQKRET